MANAIQPRPRLGGGGAGAGGTISGGGAAGGGGLIGGGAFSSIFGEPNVNGPYEQAASKAGKAWLKLGTVLWRQLPAGKL